MLHDGAILPVDQSYEQNCCLTDGNSTEKQPRFAESCLPHVCTLWRSLEKKNRGSWLCPGGNPFYRLTSSAWIPGRENSVLWLLNLFGVEHHSSV